MVVTIASVQGSLRHLHDQAVALPTISGVRGQCGRIGRLW